MAREYFLGNIKGTKGDKGDKGDSFKFEDFSSSQIESLKGQKGDKGDAFKYEDFTPTQLESLKGPKGDTGQTGATGPAGIIPQSELDKISNVLTVATETQNLLNNKVDKVSGKGLSTNDYSTAEKNKLDGIASNANNYTHPSTHAPSVIVQDASNRFVSDAEKTVWNSKASTSVATSSASGLMSSTDKSKLDGIASNANNYSHPSTHSPSIISQDASNRFVTDAEKSTWSSKASTSVASSSASGLMSSTDKSKLDGIASNANNYTHPSTHVPSIIVQDASNRFVTDAEKTKWNSYKSLRSSSIIIAPSNSSEINRQNADVTLLGDATDAVKINEAINSLTYGGELKFLEGSVKCYSTINLQNDICIAGQGNSTIFQKYFDNDLFDASGKKGIILKDFKIDGNLRNGYALHFAETINSKMKDIVVSNATSGMDINTCESVSVLSSRIETDLFCINLSNCCFIKIDDCYCAATTKSAINLNAVACNKCVINNSTIISAVTNTLYLRQFNYGKVINCYIESTDGSLAGSLIQSTYNTVSNNTFKSTNNQMTLTAGNNNLCVANSGKISSTEGSTTIVVNNLL